jgi:hypothetical protein
VNQIMLEVVFEHVCHLFNGLFVFYFFLAGDFSLDFSLSRVPSFSV